MKKERRSDFLFPYFGHLRLKNDSKTAKNAVQQSLRFQQGLVNLCGLVRYAYLCCAKHGMGDYNAPWQMEAGLFNYEFGVNNLTVYNEVVSYGRGGN